MASKETKNGSLLLAWQVNDRHVLVIGAGAVALSRIEHLLRTRAKITVVAKTVSEPQLTKFESEGKIRILQKQYDVSDLSMYIKTDLATLHSHTEYSAEDEDLVDRAVHDEQFALVLAAIDDPNVSRRIYLDCKIRGIQVNIADRPPQCDFYFGSMLNQGSLQIMISTNGKSPRLSKRIKDEIGHLLTGVDFDKAVQNLGYLREKVRQEKMQGTDVASIKERMEWNKSVTDTYSIQQWSQLDEHHVDKILARFPSLPPAYDELIKS